MLDSAEHLLRLRFSFDTINAWVTDQSNIAGLHPHKSLSGGKLPVNQRSRTFPAVCASKKTGLRPSATAAGSTCLFVAANAARKGGFSKAENWQSLPGNPPNRFQAAPDGDRDGRSRYFHLAKTRMGGYPSTWDHWKISMGFADLRNRDVPVPKAAIAAISLPARPGRSAAGCRSERPVDASSAGCRLSHRQPGELLPTSHRQTTPFDDH